MTSHRAIVADAGFTLLELLVVLSILAVLAALVVPSFGAAGEDAKLSTLRADLARMRGAVERYAAEHGGRVPGVVSATDGVTPPPNRGLCQQAVLDQLTQHTNAAGMADGVRSATFPLGPYLKDGVPPNPFLAGTAASVMVCDIATADLNAAPTADGESGWKLHVLTGRLVANDATVLAGGRPTVAF